VETGVKDAGNVFVRVCERDLLHPSVTLIPLGKTADCYIEPEHFYVTENLAPELVYLS
jgi:hypothetical protein